MDHGVPSARPLVAAALVGALVQLLASVRLAVASLSQLQSAAAEGAEYYVLAVAVSAVGLGVAWRLRRRPLAAVAVLMLWQLLVFWPLRDKTSLLGLAFHGEAIAHHFAAVLAAAVCVLVPLRWAARRSLGRARFLPLVQSSLGVALLLLAHVLPNAAIETTRRAALVGAALLLTTAISGVVVLWRSTRDGPARIAVLALVSVAAVRIGLAGLDGLVGAPVPSDRMFALMAAACIAAALAFVLLRPRLELPQMALVNVASALAVAYLYWVYRRNFGTLEDSVGGLAQSLLGFWPPYPEYVAAWKVWLVMFAVFFVLNTVYSALLSERDRDRGFALGLLLVAGLGLTSPQLVLMVGAAFLALIDTLTRERAAAQPVKAPDVSPVDMLSTLTEGLSLPGPVVLDASEGSVVAVRGTLRDTQVDLRVRPRKRGWDTTLRLGLVGKGRPELELVPDAGGRGQRPDHELGRTHRIRGNLRDLEQLGEPVLDALRPFPTAHVRLWAAGTEVAFGPDLSNLDADTLAALVRVLVER